MPTFFGGPGSLPNPFFYLHSLIPISSICRSKLCFLNASVSEYFQDDLPLLGTSVFNQKIAYVRIFGLWTLRSRECTLVSVSHERSVSYLPVVNPPDWIKYICTVFQYRDNFSPLKLCYYLMTSYGWEIRQIWIYDCNVLQILQKSTWKLGFISISTNLIEIIYEPKL